MFQIRSNTMLLFNLDPIENDSRISTLLITFQHSRTKFEELNIKSNYVLIPDSFLFCSTKLNLWVFFTVSFVMWFRKI